LQQIRGKEGVRVRDTYARMSRETGVAWAGRQYSQNDWDSSDPINKALSTANACLHAIVHAAVVATGFSPGLGFVHTGKSRSFVYDIADLYKCELTVPAAFKAVAEGTDKLETRVRRTCREMFFDNRIIQRIVPDIQRVLGLKPEQVHFISARAEDNVELELWDPEKGVVHGGLNYASES